MKKNLEQEEIKKAPKFELKDVEVEEDFELMEELSEKLDEIVDSFETKLLEL